jgi:hypothetical protein
MNVFKIRRKADGLYSTGGGEPRWNKKGKVWNGIGQLKNHLNLFKPQFKGDVDTTAHTYKGCEIVWFELELAEIGSVEVVTFKW